MLKEYTTPATGTQTAFVFGPGELQEIARRHLNRQQHGRKCVCEMCEEERGPSVGALLRVPTDPALDREAVWRQVADAEQEAAGITAADLGANLRRIELLERAACLRRLLATGTAEVKRERTSAQMRWVA